MERVIACAFCKVLHEPRWYIRILSDKAFVLLPATERIHVESWSPACSYQCVSLAVARYMDHGNLEERGN